MRVIFTGQMGLQKDLVMKNLAKLIMQELGYASSDNTDHILQVHRFESYVALSKMAERGWVEYPDVEKQFLQWHAGFNNFLSAIRTAPPKNLFLGMHAVIYKYSRYISPIDWNLVREFKPDLFVTLIDDVYDIWWRINRSPSKLPGSEEYKLRELMAWRSSEIMATQTLARNLFPDNPRPHYVVAIKHPVSALVKLILHPKTLRVYSAYPITDAKKTRRDNSIDGSIIREIDENRATLHSRYMTFDPITVDEFELKILREEWEKEKAFPLTFIRQNHRWPMKTEICNLPLLSDVLEYAEQIDDLDPIEIEAIEKDMSFQIRWRDFTLLDQVHCMAAYRPSYNKGSIGVQRELAYAEQKGIASIQFWPEKDGVTLRPFKDTGFIVKDYKEFISFLDEQQKEVLKDPSYYSHQTAFDYL